MAKITLTVELTKDELNSGAIAQARTAALASVANADSVKGAACEPTNFTPTGGTFVFDLSPASSAPPAEPAPPAAKPAA